MCDFLIHLGQQGQQEVMACDLFNSRGVQVLRRVTMGTNGNLFLNVFTVAERSLTTFLFSSTWLPHHFVWVELELEWGES